MKKLSFLFCLLVFISCKQERKDFSQKDEGVQQEHNIKGLTMGTTYSIKYLAPSNQTISKDQIDSTLLSINAAVSTYEPASTISTFNKAGKEGISLINDEYPGKHFTKNYAASVVIKKITGGMFDPTVMPLVNYWGFGYEGKNPVTNVDTTKVKEILHFVGLEKTHASFIGNKVHYTKDEPRTSLDFSAIAKGYAVDFIADLLETQNISSYMVEIGGEVKVNGKNKKDHYWKLGINKPEETASYHDIQLIVTPESKSLASSGNYRIFHKVDDISYGHEINPRTGFPHQTDILSASVIHDSCMYADAYATAFMILGLEKSLDLVNKDRSLEACFIIKENGELKNIYSNGFEQYVVQ